MKVLALTRYGRLGASSRLRFLQYAPLLAAAGIELQVQSLFPDRLLAERNLRGSYPPAGLAASLCRRVGRCVRPGGPRLVWLEYELFPGLPAWAERLLLAGTGVPFVLELDDAVFHRYDRHRSAIVRSLLGRKLDRLMRRASTVVVCNEYLAERARAAGARRIETVPTPVDLGGYPVAARAGSGPFTIGWVGSSSTAEYLRAVAGPLRRACERLDGRVVVVGTSRSPLEGPWVEHAEWSEQTEAARIASFDVGIMPLEDGPWERGKCGYKLLQYMAASRAVVASPVGINATLVRPGWNGLLASTDEEWTSALEWLGREPEGRATMGANGRSLVASSYSLDVLAPRVAGLLKEASNA